MALTGSWPPFIRLGKDIRPVGQREGRHPAQVPAADQLGGPAELLVAVGERAEHLLLAAHQVRPFEPGVGVQQAQPDRGPARPLAGHGLGPGDRRADRLDDHVVLALGLGAGRGRAELAGHGEPARGQVGDVDAGGPVGQRDQQAEQPDGAAAEHGHPLVPRAPGQRPGVHRVGRGLDHGGRVPGHPGGQRAQRGGGHGDPLGEPA